MKRKKSDKANLENKRGIFFLIGLVVALGSVLVAFEWKTKPTAADVFDYYSLGPDETVYIPPTPNEKKELPPQKIEPPSFILVEDDVEVENSFDPIETEPTDDNIFNLEDFIISNTKDDIQEKNDALIIAEIMPEFPGGQKSLIRYLSSNIKYPVIAQENGIKGKVYVSFVIDEMGNINDVNILRGVDVSLDNEALRVVRSMPKWKPGRQGGKAVKVRYNVPIVFELQ